MEVAKLKVVELRKRLQDMGLDTTGLKAVLVQRLESAMQADKAPPAEAKQEDDEAATEAVKVATGEDVARNTAAKAAADNEAAVAAAATAAKQAAALADAKAKALASAKVKVAQLAAQTAQVEQETEAEKATEEIATGAADHSAAAKKKLEKKRRRRKNKQQVRKEKPNEEQRNSTLAALAVPTPETKDKGIEYVADDTLEMPESEEYEDLKRVFGAFAQPGELLSLKVETKSQSKIGDSDAKEKVVTELVSDATTDGNDDEGKELSKKKKKVMGRISNAQLKNCVEDASLVEVHDTNASDPRLLLHLKSLRNTVPVPRHWQQKRKYLQGKRGIEKAPWQLPEFIEATGIAKIREAYMDKANDKTAKQKQREKVGGKANKIDIDYQILHDAFFRFQTKPDMSLPGELYYEGKEFEVNVREKRAGHMSDDLSGALGMPAGAPPPWLINMQRYGPPPSYPNLKIQGLNAPIPEGAQFGYHPGGWGKPPVDEFGRPLYGDVFGTQAPQHTGPSAPIERQPWGEMEEESDESSSEEEEEDQGGEQLDEESSESGISSVTSIASMSSLASGLETPDAIDLRKDSGPAKGLYQVIEQKDTRVGGALMGSSHQYVMPKEGESMEQGPSMPKGTGEALLRAGQTNINVALDPKDLESDEAMQAALKRQFDGAQAEEAAKRQRDDLSGMVVEEETRLAKKRKAAAKKQGDKAYKNVF